jgi:hypothetical protein
MSQYHVLKKVLIMGRACSGKSTIAKNLHKRLTGVILNAENFKTVIAASDEVDFAKKLNYVAELIVQNENWCIVDYCADTEEIRNQFTDCFIVWMDRGVTGDKNPDFTTPTSANYHVMPNMSELTEDQLGAKILLEIHKWWNRPKSPMIK